LGAGGETRRALLESSSRSHPASGATGASEESARYLSAMISPSHHLAVGLADAVEAYRSHADAAQLRARLLELIEGATPDALIVAVEPFREIPEVAGPLYERIVEAQPDNARALVILASAYWLGGRGPEVVGDLASRAIAADPTNRGGWHLWALSESDPRQRLARWRQVTARFPNDHLALANVADNAASLAGAEQDQDALDLAIATYEHLLASAELPEQRAALETALRALRGWRM